MKNASFLDQFAKQIASERSRKAPSKVGIPMEIVFHPSERYFVFISDRHDAYVTEFSDEDKLRKYLISEAIESHRWFKFDSNGKLVYARLNTHYNTPQFPDEAPAKVSDSQQEWNGKTRTQVEQKRSLVKLTTDALVALVMKIHRAKEDNYGIIMVCKGRPLGQI